MMISRLRKHRLLPFRALTVLSLLIILAVSFPRAAFPFTFSVLSDPQWSTDGWVNALTEIRDSKISPDLKFGQSELIFVPGDTPPIDVIFGEYTKIFKGAAVMPLFLPVIGNHDADDKGGFPGGMAMIGGSMGPEGGMGQGAGAPPGQSGGVQPSGMGPGAGMGGMGMGPGGGMGGISQVTGDPSIIDMDFISDKIITAIPGAVRMSDKSCTYYYDKENVRIISMDAFSGEAGTGGVITDKGRAWTEKAITSAPSTIDHIFIGFHAPAFPRGRHSSDCFVTNAEQRNAFWNMLIAHKDKVRAVFNGHTHAYSRMRILNPLGADANDFSKCPDEEGGIYQVNAGSTSQGMKNTFVKVQIKGKDVYFRTYEAENGKDQLFAIKDEWGIINAR
jgi:hypothetical protein